MTPPTWVLAVDWICGSIMASLNRPPAPPSQCMRLSEYRRNRWTGMVGGTVVYQGKVQGLRFEW